VTEFILRSSIRWLFVGGLPLILSACGGGGDSDVSSAKGDPSRGAQLYVKECQACHSLTSSDNAPMHCGLLGRKAGTVPGFAYSEAMRSSQLVWDEKTLDEFLTAPYIVLPGTIMGFPGFGLPEDRADVIAYLKQVDADASKCKK